MEIKTRTNSHAREERMDFKSVKPPHTHRPHSNKNKQSTATHSTATRHTHHPGRKQLGAEGHTVHDSISQQTVTVTWLGMRT